MIAMDDVGPPEDQDAWKVMDTETTGMESPPVKNDQAIEWSVAGPMSLWTVMFKPIVPIHCAARASHHITDEELADKPVFQDWLATCNGLRPFGDARYLVAHNAEFDLTMLRQTGVPADFLPEKIICTWKCAKHLWPDAPSHKNQALRYHFDLVFTDEEKDVMAGLAAHRAPYDTIVTRGLLRLMLQDYTLYQLEKLTRTPFLIPTITFGKYRGKRYEDIVKTDRKYLQWIWDQGPLEKLPDGSSKGFDENTRYTVQFYLNG